jgi:hypothetical protein
MMRLRKIVNRRRSRLQLEVLENRTLLSGAGSPNPVKFLSDFSPYDFAPASTVFDPVGFDPTGQSGATALLPPGPAGDPGALGPYAVTEQTYDFGNSVYVPPQFGTPTSANRVELTGEVYAPTDLSTLGPLPLVVLMHGNHYSTYQGGSAFYPEWPPAPGHTSLPNYLGYGYFADVLASHGYVVVSVSANGVNVFGNSFAGTGMLARGQLIKRTLDIFSDVNTDGVVHTRTGDTSSFVDGQMPFGTRFVGKINMQDVGLMGHSRGGEGAVQGYLVNQAAGSPYGVKAVFALAPVDFLSEPINNVPFAVLLPYNDGDVSDLQGAHFFDDSRYNVGGDTGAKFTIEVMGASHNFYNTIWSPGGFQAGTSDDGNPGPPTRLTQTQQRGTGLAYMSAFFRTYLGGETQFLPILTGDAAPPPSAQVPAANIHLGYLPPDNSTVRRDINRLTSSTNLTTNTLGGSVVTGGLATYTYTTTGSGSSEPHRNLGQVSIGYTGTLAAFYENDLPAAARDESAYADLQFRIGVNYADARNPTNTAQDFSVELRDSSGHSHSVLVSAYSNDLFDPPTPSSNPHEVLNTVRIPLSAFIGFVDLTNVTAVRLDFDQHMSGAFQLTDLAFADFNSAGPYVTASTPSGNVLGAQSSVRFTFDRAINPATFTTGSVDSFTVTVGSTVTDISGAIMGVTPVSGTNNQFDVTFTPQTTLGLYQLTIGPNILDLNGHAMDQNHNGIPGEIPGDEYTASFTIQGLRVVSVVPNGSLPGQISQIRVTFNEAVDLVRSRNGHFSLTGPDGSHRPTGATEVSGSGATQFDVTFDPLTVAGPYTLVLGPDVYDLTGNPMDQDGDLIPGESSDAFTASGILPGPRVTATSPTGTVTQPVSDLIVTFNEPILPSSFMTGQITSFTRGTTDLLSSLISVTPVTGSSNTQFDIAFTTQGANGDYALTLASTIADPYGNPLGSADPAQFTITGGPHVVSYSPAGSVSGPIDHVTVTFDRAIAASSFMPAQVSSFTGPGGPITVTGVVEVSGSSHTQFNINFAPQSGSGSYSLTLSTAITDVYGNPLIGTTAAGNLVTNGGFETGSFSGWNTIPASSGSDFVVGAGAAAHSGIFGAEFGGTTAGAYDTITQTLTTVPGQQYTFDYWLANAGGPNNGFRVMWGSTVVQDLVDSSAFAYTHYTFTVTATSTSTTISFAGYQVPSFYYLDDVSVTGVGGSLTDTFTIA